MKSLLIVFVVIIMLLLLLLLLLLSTVLYSEVRERNRVWLSALQSFWSGDRELARVKNRVLQGG